MTIILSPDLERRVRELVDRGDYPSVEALVDQALSLFLDDEGEEEDIVELRAQIQAANEEIERGEYLDLDEAGIAELAKDVHRRGLARLAQHRSNRL